MQSVRRQAVLERTNLIEKYFWPINCRSFTVQSNIVTQFLTWNQNHVPVFQLTQKSKSTIAKTRKTHNKMNCSIVPPPALAPATTSFAGHFEKDETRTIGTASTGSLLDDDDEDELALHDSFFFRPAMPQQQYDEPENDCAESADSIRYQVHERLCNFFGHCCSVYLTESGDSEFQFGNMVFRTSVEPSDNTFSITACGYNTLLFAADPINIMRLQNMARLTLDESRFELSASWHTSALNASFNDPMVMFLMQALSLNRVC